MAERWEYRTLRGHQEDWHLNVLGLDGWELVAVTDVGSGIATGLLYVFKRAIDG